MLCILVTINNIHFHRALSLTRWSKEGIRTIIETNSSTVKCLCSHLSSFAVVAENLTILKQIAKNKTVTLAPATEPPTSMNHMSLLKSILYFGQQHQCLCHAVVVRIYSNTGISMLHGILLKLVKQWLLIVKQMV